MFQQLNPIILASQSPRRRQLLEWAEIPFRIVTEVTDESWPAGMAVEEAPVHIARNKALTVQQKHGLHGETILAADTIVVLDGDIIGKPKDREDAIANLCRLSGKTHQVITGVIILNGHVENTFYDISKVTFHPLSPAQISYYVDAYQPYDKAGAYAIQEWIGVVGIKSIEGDFYNVMGLPVSRVVQELYKKNP